MDTLERQLACPVCGSNRFGTYRGRLLARCAGCGLKERGRALAMVLRRLAPPPSGSPVYHFAPDKQIGEILIELYGEHYVPADIDPAAYDWSPMPLRKVDLCRPLDHIEGPLQGVVHSHVLEHVPAPLERVLRHLNALIEPGGFHIFQVPIHKGWYREDMDPDLPESTRERVFYQKDHMRVFGQRDFDERVLDLFEGFEAVDVSKHIGAEDLLAAAVPASALASRTGHSVFFYRKKAGSWLGRWF